VLHPAVRTILLLAITSCASPITGEEQLHVFAAASLTDAFGEIETRFEDSHPTIDVRLNLLSSAELAQQIEQGAPADVFASADSETMGDLERQNFLASEPEVFATNKMIVIVEPGNPLGIERLSDLSEPSLVVSLAAPGVPAGDYAREVLFDAGVEVSADSEEQDVRAVLTRVATGEADAGIVYESDAASTDAVATVPVPPEFNVVASYPIATVAEADDDDRAQEFVSLVTSEEGRQVLVENGFRAP
jgi:molybdate transport system substrate-binding protein